MMRGPKLSSMTVRLADGSLDTETWNTHENGKPAPISSVPFLRGIYNMLATLSIGIKCLNKSAVKSGNLEASEPSEFEKSLGKLFGTTPENASMGIAVALGVILAIIMFIAIPTLVSSLLNYISSNRLIISFTEGVLKLVIFLAYLYMISLNKDVARVLQYHGAEHKTIACYEAGEELTPENCAKFTRLHPRCGTSFLLIVIIMSIVLATFIPSSNPLVRMLFKLLLMPVIIGVSYEIIKLTAKYSGTCSKIVAAPGLWVQRLTTKEPDLSQLEVSISAMKAVLPDDPADAYD